MGQVIDNLNSNFSLSFFLQVLKVESTWHLRTECPDLLVELVEWLRVPWEEMFSIAFRKTVLEVLEWMRENIKNSDWNTFCLWTVWGPLPSLCYTSLFCPLLQYLKTGQHASSLFVLTAQRDGLINRHDARPFGDIGNLLLFRRWASQSACTLLLVGLELSSHLSPLSTAVPCTRVTFLDRNCCIRACKGDGLDSGLCWFCMPCVDPEIGRPSLFGNVGLSCQISQELQILVSVALQNLLSVALTGPLVTGGRICKHSCTLALWMQSYSGYGMAGSHSLPWAGQTKISFNCESFYFLCLIKVGIFINLVSLQLLFNFLVYLLPPNIATHFWHLL